MKYIVTEQEGGVKELFIFPKTVNHDCMAEMLSYIKDQCGGNWSRVWREPVSAGFVSNDLRCYGRSETLNLDSRPEEDTALLKKQIGVIQ